MTRTRALRLLAIALGISALSLCVANLHVQAAFEAYLKIKGLDGGSKDPAHKGWISVSHVVAGDLNREAMSDREASEPSVSELAVRKAGGPQRSVEGGHATAGIAAGMASGKRTYKPFTITKEWGASSPQLQKLMTSGTMIPEMEVDLENGRFKLSNVTISSIRRSAGPGGNKQLETITFNYQKIEKL